MKSKLITKQFIQNLVRNPIQTKQLGGNIINDENNNSQSNQNINNISNYKFIFSDNLKNNIIKQEGISMQSNRSFKQEQDSMNQLIKRYPNLINKLNSDQINSLALIGYKQGYPKLYKEYGTYLQNINDSEDYKPHLSILSEYINNKANIFNKRRLGGLEKIYRKISSTFNPNYKIE